MKTQKYYYKVVNSPRETLGYESAWANCKYNLKYEVNNPTIPTIGKLFVFDTLKNAEDYIAYTTSYRIFKCNITGKPIIPTCILNSGFIINNDYFEIVMKFWENEWYLKPFIKSDYPFPFLNVCETPPTGTILVDSVTLI